MARPHTRAVVSFTVSALRKYFGKRGERVVQDNLKAVARGFQELMEIPQDVMAANPGKGAVVSV